MIRRFVIAAGFATLLASPAAAQVPGVDVRLGAHAVIPSGDLADRYDSSFGAYGRIGAPVGPIKLMGSVTWNRFKAKDGLPLIEDEDLITIQAGPHFSTAMLDLGVEFGYISNIEEFGFMPNISLGLGSVEVTAGYNTTFSDPKASWMTVGFGFRF